MSYSALPYLPYHDRLKLRAKILTVSRCFSQVVCDNKTHKMERDDYEGIEGELGVGTATIVVYRLFSEMQVSLCSLEYLRTHCRQGWS